ncbi:MAG: sigma-54 interaction domain-containing protein [Tissierella sp.]|uniref:sigma-54 interaction domain-containing protein n=1 Tax=Tissierella sp. TaxID=41274 RepID=UPI003F9A92DE
MDYNYINNLNKHIPLPTVITSNDGMINSINIHTLKMFGYKESELLNTYISNLFEGFDRVREDISLKKPVREREVYVYTRSNKLRLTISAYAIYFRKNKDFDLIFLFEDIKKERKLSDKILENRAIYTFDKIISENKDFLGLIDFAKGISNSKSTVLIGGETGTGKEVFAQSIHNRSMRKNKPFIAINSAAIPENLIESELFGYVGGAFTGAKSSGQVGKFELADKGTIFLDEIGEMPLKLQTRLLRVIEEGIVSRVGGIDQTIVDIRIIAASNRNLKKEVAEGRFREDLFYRLNVLPLTIPPLRKRKDDIVPLANFFMKKISRRLNKNKVRLNDHAINKMMDYNWPGNIRELENLIELIINLGYLPDSFFNEETNEIIQSSRTDKIYSLEELEKCHIIKMLKLYNGNISKTSKVLQIGRNTLYNKIDKYNITVPS